MKTQEELNALKEEVAVLNAKLAELTEDELAQVVGGGEGTIKTIRDKGYLFATGPSLAGDNAFLRVETRGLVQQIEE